MAALIDTRRPSFARDLETWADAPALLDSSGTLTYRELAALADEFAGQLGPSIRMIAIETRNAREPIIAYLAALRANVPLLLHSGGPPGARVLEACPPDAFYQFDEDAGAWRLTLQPAPWAELPHPDLAVLLSTSGSTGSTKLVRLSAANLQANAASIAEYLGLSPTERAITSLPMAYSYGLSVLNSHLTVGASLVLTSEGVSSPIFRALVETHRVTSIAGVPYSYELMLSSGLLDDLPRSVRTLTQAGGGMPPEITHEVMSKAEAADARLFVMYGQTEATARMAYLPPDRLAANIGCIGGPIPGGELWIEREPGVRAEPGEDGALIYRGPNVMMGYALGRADLSAPPGSDILRTGDLAREVAPGVFRITGRESRFVKPFGLRIGLDDIETLCTAAGATVAVAGTDERVVVAVVGEHTLAAEHAITALGLPRHIFTYLAVTEIPRLASGKPDYQAILKLGAATVPPDNRDGVAQIRDLFGRLARGRAAEGDDTFVSLGGDSLHYVECSMVIETVLGELPENWPDLTLDELTAMAKAASTSERRNSLTVGTDAAARAAAIVLITVQHAWMGLPIRHTLGTMQGGSYVLMLLAGISWAKFQRLRLMDGDVLPTILDFFFKYITFYVLLSLGAGVLLGMLNGDAPRWDYVLLVSSYSKTRIDSLYQYWFLECLFWSGLVTSLLFLMPWTRALARRRPAAFGLALLLLGFVVAIGGRKVLPTGPAKSPDQLFLYFVAGWAFASTSSRWLRLGVCGLVGAFALHRFDLDTSHVFVIAAGMAMILLADKIRMPRRIAQPILLTSGAAFYLYQVNVIPMQIRDAFGLSNSWYWPISIGATFALGFGAKHLIENAPRYWAYLQDRLRPPVVAKSTS